MLRAAGKFSQGRGLPCLLASLAAACPPGTSPRCRGSSRAGFHDVRRVWWGAVEATPGVPRGRTKVPACLFVSGNCTIGVKSPSKGGWQQLASANPGAWQNPSRAWPPQQGVGAGCSPQRWSPLP